jgi:hypothetical protein
MEEDGPRASLIIAFDPGSQLNLGSDFALPMKTLDDTQLPSSLQNLKASKRLYRCSWLGLRAILS